VAWLRLRELAPSLVPIVLVFYSARYVVTHDWFGTNLHIALIVVASAVALRFFCIARNALRGMVRARRRGPDPGAGAAALVPY
jgi:hypothetical protein